MRLERRHAILFVAIALWNLLTYLQFTRALVNTEEDRSAGYFVAHGILIVVNLAIAVVLARLGWKAWKATAVNQRSS